MKKLFLFILLLPVAAMAHPGIGIVKDSKGTIYYTDLTHVWKISMGQKSIAVRDVHTHELYIDHNDKLYGEGGYYDDRSKKFYHYLWVHHPNGRIDTVVGMKEAYVTPDFSLARDRQGNGYYIKRFLAPHTDTNHIYRFTPDGKENIFATGNFKHVNWLHPQADGSILYASNNATYRVDSTGNIKLIKEGVGNARPSFAFSGNSITIWGLWEDDSKNIYAAVFSDQAVKKIATDGTMTEVYRSKGNWTPLHGVFDNDGKLWVYEGSDKNEVRVLPVQTTAFMSHTSNAVKQNLIIYILIGTAICIALMYLLYKNLQVKRLKVNQASTDKTIT